MTCAYLNGIAFEPQPYAARLTVFRAEHQPDWFGLRTDDATIGWGRLTHDDLEVRVVPGSHYSLMDRPNVEFLARSLSAAVDEADRRVGAAVASPRS